MKSELKNIDPLISYYRFCDQ